MYPLFIYPKNIDLISYRKDGKIMSDFNMIDNEVTETLGAMLPQVPLSGQTIEFITDPYYEMNDYINEGIAQDSSNVSKGLGSKLKVSIQTRRLIMKIAIQEKRVELAKKRKFYNKYVPKLEAELTLYKKKLEQIKDSATPEELSDINKVEVASKQAIDNDQTLKESVDDLFIEGMYSTEELPENMIKSEEFKVLGAPLLLPKNKRAQAVATIAYKQIIRVANPAAKKAVTLAMKDIAGEKRLNDNDSFTPVYVKYKKIRDNTGNLILYGDINDEVSAIITAHIKNGNYAGYDSMVSSKKNTSTETETEVITTSQTTTEATKVSNDGRINYFNRMIQETTAKKNEQMNILRKTTDAPTIAKIKSVIAQLDAKIKLFNRKIKDIQQQATQKKTIGAPGQAHSTAMGAKPVFASGDEIETDGKLVTEMDEEVAWMCKAYGVAIGMIAASFVAGTIISKSTRVFYQKMLNKYIDIHEDVVHFNKFKKENITRSDVSKYDPKFSKKFDDPRTKVSGYKYTYKDKVQCVYIESQYSITSYSGDSSSTSTGERKAEFILVSPECKKHEEYYMACMAVHNKIGDPVLKKYLKKVRRDGKKLGKLYKKKDEISGKLKDFIYGEETDTVIEDITVDSYFENCMETFFGDK